MPPRRCAPDLRPRERRMAVALLCAVAGLAVDGGEGDGLVVGPRHSVSAQRAPSEGAVGAVASVREVLRPFSVSRHHGGGPALDPSVFNGPL